MRIVHVKVFVAVVVEEVVGVGDGLGSWVDGAGGGGDDGEVKN